MNRRCHHGTSSGSPFRTMSALTTARSSARRYPVQYVTSESSLRRRTAVEVDGLFDPEGNHHPGEAMRRHPEDQPSLRPSTTATTSSHAVQRRASVHPTVSPTAVRGLRTHVSGPHVWGHARPWCTSTGPPPNASSTKAPGETSRSATRTGRSRRLVVVSRRRPSQHAFPRHRSRSCRRSLRPRRRARHRGSPDAQGRSRPRDRR